MNRRRPTCRLDRGFTMLELLGAVAIIAIAMAVAFPAAASVRLSLRMMQLDDDARQLYEAVQNRVSALQSDGQLSKLEAELGSDSRLSSAPADYPGGTPADWDTSYGMYYVRGDDSAATEYLVTSASDILSSSLLTGQFVIELSPSTGEVYSVYYWESDAADGGQLTYDDIKDLRTRDQRTPSLVGYYCGGAVDEAIRHDGRVDFDDVDFTLVNSEELYAKITSEDFSKAAFDPSKLSLTVTVRGASDNGGGTGSWTATYGGDSLDVSTATDEVDVILDSMRTDPSTGLALSFANITQGRFGGTTSGSIIPGANVTVSVSVTYDGKVFDSSNRSALGDKTDNSLFGSYVAPDGDPNAATVQVSCVRHLNNLRDTTHSWVWGVTAMQSVVQATDIDFDGNDWPDESVSVQSRTKGDNGYNPLSSFAPIGMAEFSVSSANSYDGGGHVLENFVVGTATDPVDHTGIFSTVGFDVSRVRIADATVYGGDCTGALAGSILNDGASVTDCHVYVTATTASGGLDYGSCGISGGSYVGGLVGDLSTWVGLSDCTATTDVTGTGDYVGGLVGASSASPLSSCSVGYDGSGSGIGCVYAGTGAGSYVGGLAGRHSGGSVSDCEALANVSGASFVGGLAGQVTSSASLSGCDVGSSSSGGATVVCTVSGTGDCVGGAVGDLQASAKDCTVVADVRGDGSCCGGFAGRMGGWGTVTGCGVRGDASSGGAACTVTCGGSYAGGFVGSQEAGQICGSYAAVDVSWESSGQSDAFGYGGFVGWSSAGNVQDCYSSGDIVAESAVGGFVGYKTASYINSCYSTSDVRAVSSAGGFVGWDDPPYGDWPRDDVSYGAVSAVGAVDSTFGGFVGVASSTVGYSGGCGYLSMACYNEFPEASASQPSAWSYEDLVGSVDDQHQLSASDSHPYADHLRGTAFPFPCVVYDGTQLPHYGDWPTAVHVTWQSGTGATLQEYDTAYGTVPAYSGPTPDYASGSALRWFDGTWSPSVGPVTSDVTFVAQYLSLSLPSPAELLAGGVTNYPASKTLWQYVASSSRGRVTTKPIEVGSEDVYDPTDANVATAIRQQLVDDGFASGVEDNASGAFSWAVCIRQGTHAQKNDGALGSNGGGYEGNFLVLVGEKIPSGTSLTVEQQDARYSVVLYDVGRATCGLPAYRRGTVCVVPSADGSCYEYDESSFSPAGDWYDAG